MKSFFSVILLIFLFYWGVIFFSAVAKATNSLMDQQARYELMGPAEKELRNFTYDNQQEQIRKENAAKRLQRK